MTSSATYKKASAALDEAARARLWSPVSNVAPPSSSRADGGDDELMDLVHEYYDGNGDRYRTNADVDEAVVRRSTWKDMLDAALADAGADGAAGRICAEAERAVRDAGPAAGDGIKKRVVEWLWDRGFDAGLCRSSGDRSSSARARDHEYIDVITEGSAPFRYIVEINLPSEFEIARPSVEYQELLLSLPAVVVARSSALKAVATAMCAAAAESIRGAGMHVPPWRRAGYMQAMWSSPYERLTGGTRTEVQEGARAVTGVRQPGGGRRFCRMETGCREMTMGREMLTSMRPLFRGL